MKKLKIIFTATTLVSCTTTPKYKPEEVRPAPEYKNTLNLELKKMEDPFFVKITKCDSAIVETNYYQCRGVYSFMSAQKAEDSFREALYLAYPNQNLSVHLIAPEGMAWSSALALMYGITFGIMAGVTGGVTGGGGHVGHVPSRVIDFKLTKTKIHYKNPIHGSMVNHAGF